MDTLPKLVGVLVPYIINMQYCACSVSGTTKYNNLIPLECLKGMMGMLTEHLSLYNQTNLIVTLVMKGLTHWSSWPAQV